MPTGSFLSGWSDGGFTAIMLGAHYPHLVAGIAPNCGNWQYANVENVALTNIPVMTHRRLERRRLQQPPVSCAGRRSRLGGGRLVRLGEARPFYLPYEDGRGVQVHPRLGQDQEAQPLAQAGSATRRGTSPGTGPIGSTWTAWPTRPWPVRSTCRSNTPTGSRSRLRTLRPTPDAQRQTGGPGRDVAVVTDGKELYAGPYRGRIDIELVAKPRASSSSRPRCPMRSPAVMDAGAYRVSAAARSPVVPDRTWLAVKGTAGDEATSKLLGSGSPRAPRQTAT